MIKLKKFIPWVLITVLMVHYAIHEKRVEQLEKQVKLLQESEYMSGEICLSLLGIEGLTWEEFLQLLIIIDEVEKTDDNYQQRGELI